MTRKGMSNIKQAMTKEEMAPMWVEKDLRVQETKNPQPSIVTN